MADATVEGIEVEELVTDENEQHAYEQHAYEQHTDQQHTGTVTASTGWPCQQRRKGVSGELPAPQRFLDLPIWMTAPARRQETEEETV